MVLPVLSFLFSIVTLLGVADSDTIYVSTTSELQSALRTVLPGDNIELAEKEFNGFFRAEIDGIEGSEIVISGTKNSVLTSWSSAFNLEASWYILKGFTIANSKKGILIDGGNFNVLQNLTVQDIDEEGIHFRFFSSDNIVEFCHIYNTGLTRPGFGEGLYIGQDNGKWEAEDKPDKCDRNIIRHNIIGPSAGENIDIKEGTCCGRIEFNYFIGTGMSNVNFDDSWIDLKGNDYEVFDNEGYFTIKDGIQVRSHMPNDGVSGCRNVFRRNKFDMTGSNENGYGIYLNSQTQCENSTLIYSDNFMLNGGLSLTNGWVISA